MALMLMTHGEAIAFWVWIVPAVVIAIGGQFVITWDAYQAKHEANEQDRGICFFIGIAWPVLLAVAALCVIINEVFKFIFHRGPIFIFKKIEQSRTKRAERRARRQDFHFAPTDTAPEETPYRSPAHVCSGCGRPLPDEKP